MDLKTYLEAAVNQLFNKLESQEAAYPLVVHALEYLRPKALGVLNGVIAGLQAEKVPLPSVQ
jgi:hypothetical protein